jgi:hypothetical protein
MAVGDTRERQKSQEHQTSPPLRSGPGRSGPESTLDSLSHLLGAIGNQALQHLFQGTNATSTTNATPPGCTDKDLRFEICARQKRCLTLPERWKAYKDDVDEAWEHQADYEHKLAGYARWPEYMSQEEFEQMDTNGSYQHGEMRYRKYYAGGGQYERDKQTREAEEKRAEPVAPAAPQDDIYSRMMQMRQIDIDRMDQMLQQSFGTLQLQPQSSAPPPPVPTCGQKRPDEATQVTLKAMQMPAPGLEEHRRERRAMLDRLNLAHLRWQQTGLFPMAREFSPYEVERDRVIDVGERWNLGNARDPDNLETAHFDEYYFRSEEEYEDEKERRRQIYLGKLRDCGHGGPDDIKCRETVAAKYWPANFARKDAAYRWAYRDMQTAMPVLREGGLIGPFVFNAAHEWLGWSSERSAAAANFFSGGFGLARAKVLKVYANRNAEQHAAPLDEMSPPATHVGEAPLRYSTPPRRETAPPGASGMLTPQPVPTAAAVPPTPATTQPAAPRDGPMRAPPGGGPRAGMTATSGTLTPHQQSNPVVEVLPRSTVPMRDFEPPETGHYIVRKPPDVETQSKILAQAGRTTDGRLRDANTGRALEKGEAVWGHSPYYQFKEMRDMAEKLKWTQAQFDEFFRDPGKWQIEYGPSNSSRVFDKVERQRPVH